MVGSLRNRKSSSSHPLSLDGVPVCLERKESPWSCSHDSIDLRIRVGDVKAQEGGESAKNENVLEPLFWQSALVVVIAVKASGKIVAGLCDDGFHGLEDGGRRANVCERGGKVC